MVLEKYENLLELSVMQLVIQSSLAIAISIGQTTLGVWKNQMLMLFVAKLGINPNHYPKRISKSFPANYSKKFV